MGAGLGAGAGAVAGSMGWEKGLRQLHAGAGGWGMGWG